MAGAGAAAAAAMDNAASEMTKAIVQIVTSSNFHKDEILAEKFTLSQAYCLLWQNAESGDVSGRKSCVFANAGAVAAVLVDLIVLGKGEVQVLPNTTLGIKDDKILFKVLDEKPTGKYLDDAIFNAILKKHFKKPDKPDKVKDWIFHDISHFSAKDQCSTITLDSLVDLGILDKKKKLIGNNYPTVKPGYEEDLVRQIRFAALDQQEPNSYIRTLLTLARAADNLQCLSDPVLQKHFSKQEYDEAKQRIKALVAVGKKGGEKYEAL